MGHGFQSLGLKRGDRILMFLDDTPAYPGCVFRRGALGLCAAVDQHADAAGLAAVLSLGRRTRVAVAEAEFTSRFKRRPARTRRCKRLVVVNGAAGEHAVPKPSWRSNGCRASPTDLPEADTQRDDMAFWMYSSGSTGRPKGIVHLQHDMAYSEQAFARNVTQADARRYLLLGAEDLLRLRLWQRHHLPVRGRAATLLLPGQPKPAAIFEAIEKYRPSVFYGLPTLYTSLTKAEGASATDFSSLRMALSAAEVLSADVFNGWKALTALEIIEGLGSTEALHIYLSNRPENKKLGAAGLRVPGYEILLKDKDGREVGDNEEGILWVRGDSNTPLYWNRPDKSAETIREQGLDLHRRPFSARCRRFPFLPRPRRRPDQDFGPVGLPARSRALPGRTSRHPGMRRVRRRTA
jgi:acetyl-CoA synthetase